MAGAQVHGWARRRARGFTLIELMAVVVVISILAAIALPTYMEHVRKSRRAEAVSLLGQLAQAQERWRANNPAYTNSLGNLGMSTASGVRPAYYVLSIPAATASTYTLTATADAASAQVSDTKCTSLSLLMNGGNLTYARTGTATANQCWNR
jgi:type IV pilus assembly protein PilE